MTERDPTTTVLNELRASFRSEPRLGPHFRFVEMALDGAGVLTLAGEAPSVAAKKRALACAAAHDAVRAIVDRVHVAPAAQMGDAEIRDHLRKFFTREPAFAGYAVRQVSRAPAAAPEFETVADEGGAPLGRIDIEVRDGVATLNGHVPSLTAKRLAGVMAWWVPGVRDVINGLEALPPEEDAPIRIEEAVRVVLDRDPFVDASQIRVGVRDRTVRLTGAVPGEALRDMAERDAWCVIGVDDVVNEIEVVR